MRWGSGKRDLGTTVMLLMLALAASYLAGVVIVYMNQLH